MTSEEKMSRITIRLEEGLLKEIDNKARSSGLNRSNFVRYAIISFMKTEK